MLIKAALEDKKLPYLPGNGLEPFQKRFVWKGYVPETFSETFLGNVSALITNCITV